MMRVLIPVLTAFLSVFSQLDTSLLGDNTWVSLIGDAETFSINKNNWAYENDFQSHPFYGFFVMGPGHVVHPQDCKFYPFDPVRKQWFILNPPRVPPRRCLSSFAINSQDTLIIQMGGGDAGHQQGQGAWNPTYTLIDLGGKRRGMWAYSFNRNEWSHIAGPVLNPAGSYSPAIQYDPVHDLVVAPNEDSAMLYNYHINTLLRTRIPYNFRDYFYSTTVDTRRGLTYVICNSTFYKFNPETMAWSVVAGTTPPCPTGASDGNGTGLNQLAYDDINDIILYTGDDNTAGGAPVINTWIFDCDSLQWTRMSPTTAPLDRGRLAYNRALNAFMLLGGTANAWISRGGSTKGAWIYRYKRGPGVWAGLPEAPDAVVNTLGATPLLQWKSLPGVSGYNVYRGTANPFPKGYVKITASPVTDTFYNDASASAATAYVYRVCAVQGGSEGRFSRILYARPGLVVNVVASVEDTHAVRVSWDALPANLASGYNVYEASGPAGFAAPFPGSYVKLNASPLTGTEFVDSVPGGVIGYARVYIVTAVNGLGLEGGPSLECTTSPDSPERACAFSVNTAQGLKMALHWQPPRRTRITGVNLYHVHPPEQPDDSALITIPCMGADYFMQPGEPGRMNGTRMNGTKALQVPITDTLTYWPLPPAPLDNTGFLLQTQTYIVRAVNIMGREGFGTDQISPVNTEFGNGVILGSMRFDYGDWSPLAIAVEKRPPAAAAAEGLTAFPNPFNPMVTISFSALGGEDAVVSVFNTAGKKVMIQSGRHSAVLDMSGKPSGVYLVEVRMGKMRRATRVVLAR